MLRDRIRKILNPPKVLLPAKIFSQIHFGACAIREPSFSAASLHCSMIASARNLPVPMVYFD